MKDLLSVLQLQDVVWVVGVMCIIVISLIQALSKKHDPWLWLLEKFGEAINKKVIDKQNAMEGKIDKLQKEINQNKELDAINKTNAARRRILRFSDEVRLNKKHSLEVFNEVLNDIKMYQDYCRKHPSFKNDKAVISIELIEEVYKTCLKDNSFL